MSEFELVYDEAAQAEPRFLFANFTSGLVIVNSTLLAIAALGLLGLGGNGHLMFSTLLNKDPQVNLLCSEILLKHLIMHFCVSALAYLLYFLTQVSYISDLDTESLNQS